MERFLSSSCDRDQILSGRKLHHSALFPPTDIFEAASSSESPPIPHRRVIALYVYWSEFLTSHNQIDTLLKCLLGPSYVLTRSVIKEQLYIQDEDPAETLIAAIRRATLSLSKGDTFCFLYSGLITDRFSPATSNLIEPNPALETWLDKMIQTGTWPEDSRRLLSVHKSQDTTQRLGSTWPSHHERAGQEHVFLYGTNERGEHSAQVHYSTVHQTCFEDADFEVLSSVGLRSSYQSPDNKRPKMTSKSVTPGLRWSVLSFFLPFQTAFCSHIRMKNCKLMQEYSNS